MLKVNDKIVHAREGLATIVDTLQMDNNNYFVIQTDNGNGNNIYVLQSNFAKTIRPVMNEDEANQIVDYMKTVNAEFISNTKQRRDHYKRKLISGDAKDLAYLSRQLHFFNEYNANGQVVKLGPTDLQMLKDAESILFDELSLSFKKARDKISSFIQKLIDGK